MIAGLKNDDIIISIDGNKVKSIIEVSKFIMMSTEKFIDFTVNRSNQNYSSGTKVKQSKYLSGSIGSKTLEGVLGIIIPFCFQILSSG